MRLAPRSGFLRRSVTVAAGFPGEDPGRRLPGVASVLVLAESSFQCVVVASLPYRQESGPVEKHPFGTTPGPCGPQPESALVGDENLWSGVVCLIGPRAAGPFATTFELPSPLRIAPKRTRNRASPRMSGLGRVSTWTCQRAGDGNRTRVSAWEADVLPLNYARENPANLHAGQTPLPAAGNPEEGPGGAAGTAVRRRGPDAADSGFRGDAGKRRPAVAQLRPRGATPLSSGPHRNPRWRSHLRRRPCS